MEHPLAQAGWLEFNRLAWDVQPQRLMYSAANEDVPALETVVYTNRQGKLVLPPYNPFLPVEFRPTATDVVYRVAQQWITVATLAAEDWRKRGLHHRLMLAPNVLDIRPWHWKGFRSSVRYTYCLDLPYQPLIADTNTRRDIRKAQKEGFTCEPASDLSAFLLCLQESASRQNFDSNLQLSLLQTLRNCMPPDRMRLYICRSRSGEPASARGILHAPGQYALDLFVGNASAFRSSGASKLLQLHVMDDLYHADAAGFDLEGANLPDVAASKLKWGARLVPYYSLELHDVRSMARFVRSWWHASRH